MPQRIPSCTPSPAGKVRLKVVLGLAAIIVLATVASAHSMSAAHRFAVGHGYLRLARVWARDFPLQGGKPIPYLLEPVLIKIGVLPVRAEIEPGVSLFLDPRDLIMRTILETGEWEPENWQAISTSLSEGAVFLDVGAHIGYDSLKAAVKVGKSGLVVSFEPNPDTLKLLRDNVAASNAANVIVEPIACTDREQMLTLYGGPEDNTGTASLSRQNVEFFSSAPPRQFTVRGRPIDDVVRELGLKRVDVIKVDVEGAEYYVLRGARETLRRFHPKVVVEIIPRQLAAMQTKVEDVVSLLREAGYNQSRQLGERDWEWTAQAP